MGTICILLGLIILVCLSAGGYLLSNAILSNSLYMSLLGTTSTTMVYIEVIGVCFFIGLLICLGLVMNGLIYNKLSKTEAKLNRMSRHSRKSED